MKHQNFSVIRHLNLAINMFQYCSQYQTSLHTVNLVGVDNSTVDFGISHVTCFRPVVFEYFRVV